MAQRDLDAALQLLADRAQFITGASGAAIALRRQGRNDMLCRASTGSNAPELGALLSTEFGLSGESVRTRRLLHCDDAERDARVNRDVCRQLGIASVVVMPVVRDHEVLGVFELFSGKTNAFGERDLSAVQRLGQMVETAVQLAQVTERLPEKLKTQECATGPAPALAGEEEILDARILGVEASGPSAGVGEEPDVLPSASEIALKPERAGLELKHAAVKSEPALTSPKPPQDQAGAESTIEAVLSQTPLSPKGAGIISSAPPEKPEAKPLFWSAGVSTAVSERPADNEMSNVPPVLRGLRKCEACGFPISGGRVLCVECEEKRWRGQLKRPQPMPTGAIPPSSAAKGVAQVFAAAQAVGAGSPLSRPISVTAAKVSSPVSPAQPPVTSQAIVPAANTPVFPAAGVSSTERDAGPIFVLRGALEEPQSWFSSNKYVIVAMILVTVLIVGFLWSR